MSMSMIAIMVPRPLRELYRVRECPICGDDFFPRPRRALQPWCAVCLAYCLQAIKDGMANGKSAA